VEAGFLGQISEVQWLQSLRRRVQATETIVVAPVSPHSSEPAYPVFHASPTLSSATAAPHIVPSSYYLDDEGISLADCGNPFQLPPEHTATLLFQCYTRTVHASFPILPSKLEAQLQQYYTLVRSGVPIHCSEKWFALVNLVLAIGAKFSHLKEDFGTGELDHVIYLSRAFNLLSMNDTVVVLSTPDLSTTQVSAASSPAPLLC
jgi:hypothetical protein